MRLVCCLLKQQHKLHSHVRLVIVDNSENWEVERRDGGRRRRRVAGPSRTTTPRSPPVENRERCNSDDEYDAAFVYDCQVNNKN